MLSHRYSAECCCPRCSEGISDEYRAGRDEERGRWRRRVEEVRSVLAEVQPASTWGEGVRHGLETALRLLGG